MRRIPLSRMRPGMTLARGIYTFSSASLISPGMNITSSLIEQFKEAGLSAVIVHDDRLQDVKVNEPIREEFINTANRSVCEVYRQALSSQELDVDKIRRVAYMLVDEMAVIAPEEQLFAFQFSRASEEYLYEHLVQVAILAVAVGRKLLYSSAELRELALGALLMDIGEMAIKQDVVAKDGRYSAMEYDEMKRHCLLGFLQVRKYLSVPLASAAAILHHHERLNGSGYPQRLTDTAIHDYGRILAVCDTYDALIADRLYRRRYLPQQALGILIASAGQAFDANIVNIFSTLVAPYPIGSIVILNTGDTAIVTSVSHDSITRPIVRLLLDRNRYVIDGVMEIDLTELPDVRIVKSVEDNAVPVMWRSLLF